MMEAWLIIEKLRGMRKVGGSDDDISVCFVYPRFPALCVTSIVGWPRLLTGGPPNTVFTEDVFSLHFPLNKHQRLLPTAQCLSLEIFKHLLALPQSWPAP
jgi:hypothetical protein